MKFSSWEQNTDEWLAERRGVITASRFRDALDETIEQRAKAAKLDRKTKAVVEEAVPEIKGPSAKSRLYAQDVARERCGGTVFGPYVNAQMRYGTEQEPVAREAYERARGVFVEQVGFFKTDDSLFGISVDGLVEDDGGIEIKVLASSDVLFSVLVNKDYSSFTHQVMAGLWLLGRKWWDLVLWTPDLSKQLHVVRFTRDDNAINDMEARLMTFAKRVDEYEQQLRGVLK